ncbi:ComEA family DNA-binding protein [Dyadobacter luticola]|uniref:Helix-hairpin-helix domain-containing protein n=1 Tax=Dyadobacter luticola TaxID=1979387 RepID=A0A5R9KY37_9BACT|nr:helix-hairpin-helix domain-containing protein [Dyadobacter luticola]TLV01039.1 helix-hairpin-helix domain-containing protein [Dyadobacter luticola]
MYKKIVARLQDYFGISRKEARGALVLMMLCCLIIWSPFVFRRWILPHFPSTSVPPDLRKLDSIAVVLEKENKANFKSGKRDFKSDYKKEAKLPAKLFDFDPNTASVEKLMQLGVPTFLAKRIEKFRSKGGKFRKKEDLLAIYDFPAELFQRLESHIVLPETVLQKTFPAAHPNVTKSFSEPKKIFTKPAIAAFDINTADTTQLVQLKGIGSKLSLRILKFRDALGGFYSTNQYAEIFGLDSLALSELNRYAKISSPVTKIAINTITAADLAKHSYLRDRKIVSIIINYRNQHGPYQNMDDLRKTKVIDENLLKKIEPYLSF